jgi:hypothetical protein
MALSEKDGRRPTVPAMLDRVEDAKLVVHDHVVLGRVASLDIVELAFLVDIDENVTVDRGPEARSPDLVRLEHRVSVGEDHGPSELVQATQGFDRTGIDAFRERILDEIGRGLEQAGFVRIGAA